MDLEFRATVPAALSELLLDGEKTDWVKCIVVEADVDHRYATVHLFGYDGRKERHHAVADFVLRGKFYPDTCPPGCDPGDCNCGSKKHAI